MIADPSSHATERSESNLPWQVLDSLTAGIAVVDNRGTICAVNEAWERFCKENGGSPQATGVGTNYLDVCRAATGEDSIFAQRACIGIEEVLNGSRETYKLEYPCHAPNQERWFLLFVSRLKDSADAVVTAHFSITERKLVERQLVEAERLAGIGQAMQGLSHEGRNALQRAQGCIDLLRQHVEHDPEATHLLERIEAAQHHLLGLYEEVKSYAAPITLKCRPYCLHEIVDEVWSALQPQWTRAKLKHRRPAAESICYADAAAFSQVLRSLLENALTTGVQSPEIEVSYADSELNGKPAIMIIVDDNGPGLGAEHGERVFEPFFTTKQRGTGLGLAIARRIVSAHGGQIGFDPQRDQGASVRIILPLAGPES